MANFKLKAQVMIEFALAFMIIILFVFLTAKVFNWMGGSIIKRHKAYEDTRTISGCNATDTECDMNIKVDFYNESTDANKMDLFDKG